jgi:hypothetical protein
VVSVAVNEVKKSLENYPYKDIACEFIKVLKFGFPLNYSGPRSPITSKNLKTTPFVIAPGSTDPLFGHVRAEIPVLVFVPLR